LRYFISDTHYIGGDYQSDNILNWERNQFSNKEEHNAAIDKMFYNLVKKIKPGDEVYHLGDIGNPVYMSFINSLINKKDGRSILVMGNHDRHEDIEYLRTIFDIVYPYPVYLSNKLVISHHPVNVWPSQLNVHGHLHGLKLNSPNHICCSINDVGYKPISDKQIAAAFSKLPKFSTRFLEEPWANMYQVISRETDSLIVDENKVIDISATKAYRKAINYKGK
jgi:calcineurin-like phosphoesterase family protein